MPWRRKARPEIVFDEASRNDFLTGFKRRKDARRRQAARDALEWERYDRMQVKKEHREMVKRQWKEVAYAERKVEALMDKQETERKRKMALRGETELEAIKPMSDDEEDVAPAYFLNDRSKVEALEDQAEAIPEEVPAPKAKKRKKKTSLADNEAEESGVGKRSKARSSKPGASDVASQASDAEEEAEENDEAPVKTVDFTAEDEDDDPWGGCEVTTVEGALRGPSLISDNGLNWAVAIDGQEECRELTPAEDAARRRKRWENMEKQEEIRLEALEAKIDKNAAQKKKEGKKHRQPKSNKKTKLGKKDRRRRTRQATAPNKRQPKKRK